MLRGVIFTALSQVGQRAFDSDKSNAEAAAKKSGKPWFRITKKTSNPTWDAVAAWAKKRRA
jgi:hypothetical protein